MDLMQAVGELESSDELHQARLLVLLLAFAGESGVGKIEGLTKLAKLDFLLRYPVFLERAVKKRNASTHLVQLQPHEEMSVESKMVRYRFGPVGSSLPSFPESVGRQGPCRTWHRRTDGDRRSHPGRTGLCPTLRGVILFP